MTHQCPAPCGGDLYFVPCSGRRCEFEHYLCDECGEELLLDRYGNFSHAARARPNQARSALAGGKGEAAGIDSRRCEGLLWRPQDATPGLVAAGADRHGHIWPWLRWRDCINAGHTVPRRWKHRGI